MLGMLEAVRGCMREQTRLDVIANNLANAATPGFKGDRVSFRDMFERRPGLPRVCRRWRSVRTCPRVPPDSQETSLTLPSRAGGFSRY
ncbi:MAG: hypothetical protein JRH05_15665 [Deltaproteobacteria bacterium]|nr:hypothetical protein [Deltaproteobacteria bacterium]